MDPDLNLPTLLEDLEVNIDELSSTLLPLLPPSSLPKTTSTLPLLEKAKLHTLLAYSIESLLFSALLTSGVDAKSHPIFTELSRLKGYFAKIKEAEGWMEREERRARLDVGAARRFIKHGLSGNERFDEMRRERVEGEKRRAVEKARGLVNRRFDEEGEGRKRGVEEEEETPKKKVKIAEDEEDEQDDDDDDDDQEMTAAYDDSVTSPSNQSPNTNTNVRDTNTEENLETAHPTKKKRGRPSKKDKSTTTSSSAVEADTPTSTSTSTRATRSSASAPKTRSEAFQALATGTGTGKTKGTGKGKGRGKK